MSGNGGEGAGGVRLDQWLFAVRITKSRSMAADACRGGHVSVNGNSAKPSRILQEGDEIRLRKEGQERHYRVLSLIEKRVAYPLARVCYEDLSPPPEPPLRGFAPLPGLRQRGSGRPTKWEGRQTRRLKGQG